MEEAEPPTKPHILERETGIDDQLTSAIYLALSSPRRRRIEGLNSPPLIAFYAASTWFGVPPSAFAGFSPMLTLVCTEGMILCTVFVL